MTLQEEQLFGAPPGDLTGVTLAISYYQDGGVGVITHGHMANRRDLMTLKVSSDDKRHTSNIIGALTPLLLRSSGMSVSGFRRWLWAAHNRLGREGFEVKIEHCGREPKY